jgi:NCS1 family nucleobase:cation symporter-1
MIIGMFVSIWLFSNQVFYVGLVPAANASFGDIAFEVGFVISAVLYVIFFKLTAETSDEHLKIPTI